MKLYPSPLFFALRGIAAYFALVFLAMFFLYSTQTSFVGAKKLHSYAVSTVVFVGGLVKGTYSVGAQATSEHGLCRGKALR